MKYIFITLSVVWVLSIQSCKQDFDITANYKEVPVVYGLLNPQENTHYIRIQKGFLIDGNAYTAAAANDSIYYSDSLFVQLKTLPSGATFTLTKVVLPKDSGIFSNANNVVFTFNGNLDSAKEYELQVKNTSNGNTISAKTKLVNDFSINVPIKGQKLPLRTVNPPAVNFYTAVNAGIYDLMVRFPYLEYDAASNTLLNDTFIEFYLLKSSSIEYILGAAPVQADFSAVTLINSLSARLEKRTDRYRLFNKSVGMTFKISAGGEQLATYISSINTQQTGIGSNEALPPYTNVTGGYGVLSSRYYKQVDSVLLTDAGLDTLACHPLSAGLRFKGSTQQICE